MLTKKHQTSAQLGFGSASSRVKESVLAEEGFVGMDPDVFYRRLPTQQRFALLQNLHLPNGVKAGAS